jgi:hypothetical protein
MNYPTINSGLIDVMRHPYYETNLVEYDIVNIDGGYCEEFKTYSFINENDVTYYIEITIKYDETISAYTYDLSYEIKSENDCYEQIKSSNFYKLYNTISYLHITNLIEFISRTNQFPVLSVNGIAGKDSLGNRIIDDRKNNMAIRLMKRHYPIKDMDLSSENKFIFLDTDMWFELLG